MKKRQHNGTATWQRGRAWWTLLHSANQRFFRKPQKLQANQPASRWIRRNVHTAYQLHEEASEAAKLGNRARQKASHDHWEVLCYTRTNLVPFRAPHLSQSHEGAFRLAQKRPGNRQHRKWQVDLLQLFRGQGNSSRRQNNINCNIRVRCISAARRSGRREDPGYARLRLPTVHRYRALQQALHQSPKAAK